MTFETVAEHFMEKDGGGASAQQGGTVVWLGHGGFPESAEVDSHFFDFGVEFGFHWESFGVRRLKGFDAKKVHAVVGASLRFHDQTRGGSGRNERGAFI